MTYMEVITLLHRVIGVHRRDEVIYELSLCLVVKVLDQIDRFLSEICLIKDFAPRFVVIID